MLVVDTEVLCSVAQRKRVGQFFFVGMRLVASVMSDGLESFLEGWPRHMLWTRRVSRVSLLCVGAFSICHGFCAVIRSSLTLMTEERATVYRYPTMWNPCQPVLPCFMLPRVHGYSGSCTIKASFVGSVLPGQLGGKYVIQCSSSSELYGDALHRGTDPKHIFEKHKTLTIDVEFMSSLYYFTTCMLKPRNPEPSPIGTRPIRPPPPKTLLPSHPRQSRYSCCSIYSFICL